MRGRADVDSALFAHVAAAGAGRALSRLLWTVAGLCLLFNAKGAALAFALFAYLATAATPGPTEELDRVTGRR